MFWYRALQCWVQRSESLQAIGKAALEQFGEVKAIVTSPPHRGVLKAGKAVLQPVHHFKVELDRADAALAHVMPQLNRMMRSVNLALKSPEYKAAHEHCVAGDVPGGLLEAHLRQSQKHTAKRLQERSFSILLQVQPTLQPFQVPFPADHSCAQPSGARRLAVGAC